MYTRNLLIKILKVKNVILYILGVILIIAPLYVLVSDLVYDIFYKQELLYIGIMVFSGAVVLLLGLLSNRWIGDANYYSGYFEGDLDGIIPLNDMALIMGLPVCISKLKLKLMRLIYMKGYKLEKNGANIHIVLESRKFLCQCSECGAEIKKSEFFTGKCSYCGGLDIHTNIFYNNQLYSIKSDISKGYGNPEFYRARHFKLKKVLAAVIWGIGAIFVLIAFCGFMDNFNQYLDDRTNRDLLDTAVVFAAILIGFMIPVINGIKRLEYVYAADRSSEYFAKRKTPYIKLGNIPYIKTGFNKKRRIRVLRRTLRKKYLKNCNFEIHKKELMLVLSKRIDKNRCPYCGSAITVPVGEDYKCTSCDRKIMYLIKTK